MHPRTVFIEIIMIGCLSSALIPVLAKNAPEKPPASDLTGGTSAPGAASTPPRDALARTCAEKAKVELSRGHMQLALNYADQANRLWPKLGAAYIIKAMVYTELEQPQKAIDAVALGLAADPLIQKQATVFDVRTNAYVQLRNWPAALTDTNKAISLNPKEGWRYKERGQIYFMWHKNDLALQDFTTAIKLQPQDLGLLKARAQCYIGLNRYKDALNDYNEALRKRPNDPVIRGLRADVYDKLGEKDLAKKDREISNNKGFQELQLP
jgi:tetratricopeptide (TPR) repeat protein